MAGRAFSLATTSKNEPCSLPLHFSRAEARAVDGSHLDQHFRTMFVADYLNETTCTPALLWYVPFMPSLVAIGCTRVTQNRRCKVYAVNMTVVGIMTAY